MERKLLVASCIKPKDREDFHLWIESLPYKFKLGIVLKALLNFDRNKDKTHCMWTLDGGFEFI